MGSEQGKFREETIAEFEASTCLNSAEIYHSFKVFRQLYENYLAYAEEDLQPLLLPGDYINTEVALPISVISENLPVLRVNPFRLKMCEIFIVSGTDMMTFVEFLDMVSAFSPKNCLQQKIFHAFQIFDMDGDGVISRSDLKNMLDLITDAVIEDDKKNIIIQSIFNEVNKDGNCDGLSTEDFHYAISIAPDFSKIGEDIETRLFQRT